MEKRIAGSLHGDMKERRCRGTGKYRDTRTGRQDRDNTLADSPVYEVDQEGELAEVPMEDKALE